MSREATRPIRYVSSNVDAIMQAGFVRIKRGRKTLYYIRDGVKYRRVRDRLIEIKS